MYNKLVRKYYLYKICSINTSKNKYVTKSAYYLCKYIARRSPYSDMNEFSKEILKLTSFFKQISQNNNIVFICTNKIFYKNFNSSKIYKKWNILLQERELFSIDKIALLFLYTNTYKFKQISYFKNEKILSVGFINFQNLPKMTDYSLLLNNKHFANVFLLHFILKKYLKLC